MKKTKAITLVLVSGLIASSCDSPEGKYIQKNDTTVHNGYPIIVSHYYWIPVSSGSPIEVTQEEYGANHGSITRGGFGRSGEIHGSARG